MKIGIPRESGAGERRVAGTPATVARLVAMGFEVVVEADAGAAAGFADGAYADAGATAGVSAGAAFGAVDVVLKVEPPSADEVALIRPGAVLIGFIYPKRNAELLDRLAARGVTTLAMDMVPRITRAQKLDALSSMANIAGYRAVVEAAAAFGSFFSGQFTAAGKVPPAKVLVIGAGVAGLAAIAAARGLGAIVRAFDTRLAVREEVESLGGEFLELAFEESGEGAGGYAKTMSKEFIDAEMALFREQAPEVDVVITTALVPGARAPLLWDRGMVEMMRPGSVVVDLAAHQGGNCELTRAGEAVDHGGVAVLGYTDLPSRMAGTASQLYGTNLVHLLDDLCKAPPAEAGGDAPESGAAAFRLDLDDVVVRTSMVTHEEAVTWPPPAIPEPTPPKPAPTTTAPAASPPAVGRPPARGAHVARPPAKRGTRWLLPVISVLLAGLWLALMVTADRAPGADPGEIAMREFVQHLTVFVMACFVGWQVIWNVTPALHTPLMSVTNAISGIIIVGGILEGGRGDDLEASIILGLIATLIATINIAGGFLVTQRMLRMFRKDEEAGR